MLSFTPNIVKNHQFHIHWGGGGGNVFRINSYTAMVPKLLTIETLCLPSTALQKDER